SCSRETPWSSEDYDEHRATERAADAAPVLEEVPHLQPQRADAQAVRGAHGRQSVQRVAPEPAAETAGRGVRRRHRQDGGDGQPQDPPAPVGRRGAGIHRRRRAFFRHPSAQPQRQHLQIQPLLPGRIPAIHGAVGRKSKAAHSAGSGHRERLRIRRRWLSRQTFPSIAAPQFSAAWARHRHGGRSLPERWLRSVKASRSRPAQQQSQRPRRRGRCSWAHEHHCCRRRWSGPSCAELWLQECHQSSERSGATGVPADHRPPNRRAT
ncbi:unnamed protein product, partial [Symbiodinium pilosum]